MFNLGGSGFSLFKDRAVTTYNPELLSLVIGDQPVKHFADQVVSIAFVGDNISVVKSIDGGTALQRQTNKDAIITFSLLQMSQTNKWLFDIQKSMLDSTQPIELPSITFTDYNLMVSWSATSAFIQKHPDVSYSATAGTTAWVMYCIDVKPNQNIKLDDSFLTSEQVLFKRVGEAIKSVGKKITAVFS